MTAFKWLVVAPFKLLGGILLAVAYLAAFALGVGLVGGGTALSMTGKGAIIGVPAMVLGFLALRELFESDRRSSKQAAQPAAWSPAPARQHEAAYAPEPCDAPARCFAAAPARGHDRHFAPRRAAYYWVPGRWTIR